MYVEARKRLVEWLRRQLIGPAGEGSLRMSPLERYPTGVLHPVDLPEIPGIDPASEEEPTLLDDPEDGTLEDDQSENQTSAQPVRRRRYVPLRGADADGRAQEAAHGDSPQGDGRLPARGGLGEVPLIEGGAVVGGDAAVHGRGGVGDSGVTCQSHFGFPKLEYYNEVFQGQVWPESQQPGRTPMNTNSKGHELFILDNSVTTWTGLGNLEEWSEIANAFDIATGFLETGAYLTCGSPAEETPQGKTVLDQLREAIDPEIGQPYTVKGYEGQRPGVGDPRHPPITLDPVNADFEPIILTGDDEGERQVISELAQVPRGNGQ